MSDVRDPDRDQQLPIPNDQPSCHDLVIQDVLERKAHGLRKYQSLLQPFNGRSQLQDAYEEVLDLAAYLRARLEEERQTGIDDTQNGLQLRLRLAEHMPGWDGSLDHLTQILDSVGATRNKS